MTLLTPPAYLQGGTYDAVKDRQYLVTNTYLPDPADASGVRGGLLPDSTAFSAAYSFTGFNGVLGPCRGIIKNTFASFQGDYEFTHPDNTNFSISGSSTTTNRNDILGMQVRDAAFSGANSDAIVAVIQGTASAGAPSDPVLPASFLPLYRLYVPANSTTPTVTQLWKRTGPRGATIPIQTTQTSDNGSYWGESQLMAASGSLPMRRRIWGADNAWHGADQISLAGSWLGSGGTGDVTVPNGTRTAVASLVIPDPGYSYKLKYLAGLSMFTNVNNSGMQMFIVLDAVNNAPEATSDLANVSTWGHGHVDGKLSATLTGSHTVYMAGFQTVGTGTATMFQNRSYLTCDIVPV